MSQMILTQANRNALPALYSTEDDFADPLETTAHVRYFWGGRSSFLATEFNGEDTLFGYTTNEQGEGEWGYASLSEFESTQTQFGGVERDMYFIPQPVIDAILDDAPTTIDDTF
jgi:hypothetical protein